MNTTKSLAVTYLGVGLSLFGFSFAAQEWDNVSLITISGVFLIVASLLTLSLKFQWQWLVKVVKHIESISVSHMVLFLMLVGFAIGLIQAKIVLPGVLVILVAYVTYGWSIGTGLGKVFQSVVAKVAPR